MSVTRPIQSVEAFVELSIIAVLFDNIHLYSPFMVEAK